MKKILCLVFLLVFSVCAFAAADDDFYVGVLAQLNMSEEEYNNFVIESRNNVGFSFYSLDGGKCRYYDSLLTLQMALNADEIKEVKLPGVVGEYFVSSNPAYAISSVSVSRQTYLAFGFLEKNTALRDKINQILHELKEDGTIEKLRVQYIENFKTTGLRLIQVPKFDGAETIKVALTGDLPPIDFVAPDGTPAGFNIAIISEIAKRAKINIDVVDTDAGARAAVLASGRADAVLWYRVTENYDHQPDTPAGVILSEPYYYLTKFVHVRKK